MSEDKAQGIISAYEKGALRIETEDKGEAAVVRLDGQIVFGVSARRLVAKFRELVGRPGLKKIIVDMGLVTGLDSTGFGVMVQMLTEARLPGIQIVLVDLRGKVKDSFQATRLITLFRVEESISRALEK